MFLSLTYARKYWVYFIQKPYETAQLCLFTIVLKKLHFLNCPCCFDLRFKPQNNTYTLDVIRWQVPLVKSLLSHVVWDVMSLFHPLCGFVWFNNIFAESCSLHLSCIHIVYKGMTVGSYWQLTYWKNVDNYVSLQCDGRFV